MPWLPWPDFATLASYASRSYIGMELDIRFLQHGRLGLPNGAPAKQTVGISAGMAYSCPLCMHVVLFNVSIMLSSLQQPEATFAEQLHKAWPG